jgi:hypothetical protein
VTVIGVMVAVGAGICPGLLSPAGSGGDGAGVAGACWATAAGATSSPTMAVFKGTRRFIILPDLIAND